MHSGPEPGPGRLNDATELFKTEFRKRYPDSDIAIAGAGYEDEDLDLVIRANGDQIELEQYAAEVSLDVQTATGYFILGFVESPIGGTR